MSRKPAHLEFVGGKGPRQRIWDRIRATKGRPFLLVDVQPGDVSHATARDYVAALQKAGYVALEKPHTPRTPAIWVLVRDAGVEAPRIRKDGSPVTQGLAQEQMWRTLRTLKSDTNARELAAYASTAEVPVNEGAAKDYLFNLERANYLECTQEGKGRGHGGVQARYRLISNTGPRPPMVQRTDALYDPNLGAVVWIRPVNEETAIYGN